MVPTLPSLFVSFSSRGAQDYQFAMRLRLCLARQPFSVWFYDRNSTSIPPSENIESYCAQKIDHSQVFVTVISESSIASWFAQREVEHVLSKPKAERPRCFSLVTTRQPLSSWPAAFQELVEHGQVKWEELDVRASDSEIEHVVNRICEATSVRFVPGDSPQLRLPLRQRLACEFDAILGKVQVRVDARFEAETLAIDFEKSYSDSCKKRDEGQSALALEVAGAAESDASRLVRKLEQHFSGASFYYPYIAWGVAKMQVVETKQAAGYPGDLRNAWKEATTPFERLRKRSSQTDENYHAALGYIDLQLGSFADALTHYQNAANHAGYDDPAIVYNVILCHILCNRPLRHGDISPSFWTPESGMVLQDPDERWLLLALLALAHAYNDNLEDMKQVLSVLLGDARGLEVACQPIMMLLDKCHSTLDREWVTAKARRAQDRCELRLRWLIAFLDSLVQHPSIQSRSDAYVNFVHHLARLYFECGRAHDSTNLFNTVLRERRPKNPQILIEAALAEKTLRQDAAADLSARKVANELRLYTNTDQRASEEMHNYWVSFADYLLGEKNAALRQFKRMNLSPEMAYDRVLRACRINV